MSDPTADRGIRISEQDVDWTALRARARQMLQHAYAPYSSFPVGAAGVVLTPAPDGAPGEAPQRRIVTGCNVENAAYGVGLCAECGLVSALHAGGGGRLVALSVVAKDGLPVAPCGRCRQVLHEAGGPELMLDRPEGVVRLSELLPDAFGPADLA